MIRHSEATYLPYVERPRSLDALAVVPDDDVALVTDAEPVQISAASASHQIFDVLGVQPMLGRGFAKAKIVRGPPDRAVSDCATRPPRLTLGRPPVAFKAPDRLYAKGERLASSTGRATDS